MNRRVRLNNVYSLAIVFIIFLGASFYILYSSINQSHLRWTAYTQKEMEKSEHLGNAIISFGYGGFIHDFKNAVLRRDFGYLKKVQPQIDQGVNSLDLYLKLAPEHTKEVLEIKSVFNEYRSKLSELEILIKNNASVALIDETVKVDDSKAIESLRKILNNYGDKSLKIIDNAETGYDVVINRLLIILGVLMLIGVALFSFIAYVNKQLSSKLKDLELIFSCAPNAIFTANELGVITSANAATMNLFGFSENAINKINVDDLVPSSVKDKHQQMRHEFQKSDRVQPMSQRNKVFYGKKLNGDVFPANISIATHAQGGEKHSIVIINDLSEEVQYKYEASTDPLTKLANRRAINAQLDLALARFKRQHTPLSICLFDIDHFKVVNDKYGHLVGDEILQKVAEVLTLHVRQTDLLGRWGGEEFVVILEDTNEQGALNFAEKVRNEIKQRSQQDDFSTSITVSVGVALCDKHDSAESLFASADKAMYESKEKGRDCVSISQC